jgi:hypothetical protein
VSRRAAGNWQGKGGGSEKARGDGRRSGRENGREKERKMGKRAVGSGHSANGRAGIFGGREGRTVRRDIAADVSALLYRFTDERSRDNRRAP